MKDGLILLILVAVVLLLWKFKWFIIVIGGIVMAIYLITHKGEK